MDSRKLPKYSKRKIKFRDISGFIVGFAGGFLFSVGLFFLSKPREIVFPAIVIHLLSPSALLGFIGLLVQEYVKKRLRAGIKSYIFYGFLGAMGGFVISIILGFGTSLVYSAGNIYMATWAGLICGLAIRLAIDEVISQRGSKDESKT